MKSPIQSFVKKRPILTCFILYILAMFFRILDIYFFKIDQAWGEIALSKIIGIMIILIFLFIMKKSISDIGFHFVNFRKNMVTGLGFIAIAFAIAYFVEYIYLLLKNYNPTLIFNAQGYNLSPDMAVNGGLIFGLWLILGNIINSFMEEGLFRGVMISFASKKISFFKANLFQALLFGLWHIVWPIKAVLEETMSFNNAIIIALGYITLSGLIGFAFGLIYIKTNSIWGSWLAHLFNNTVLNLVHIRTTSGINELQNFRVLLVTILFFATIVFVKNNFLRKDDYNDLELC